jgi:predicted MFS family arabinose efflux permease
MPASTVEEMVTRASSSGRRQFLARADSDWAVAFPGLVLLGVGGALAFPPLLGVTLDVVPRERAGMASGLSNTFFPLGTATGAAAFGAIFTARIDAALPG